MEIESVTLRLKDGSTIEVSAESLSTLYKQMTNLFGGTPVQPLSAQPLVGGPRYRVGDFPELYKIGDFPNQYRVGDVDQFKGGDWPNTCTTTSGLTMEYKSE